MGSDTSAFFAKWTKHASMFVSWGWLRLSLTFRVLRLGLRIEGLRVRAYDTYHGQLKVPKLQASASHILKHVKLFSFGMVLL